MFCSYRCAVPGGGSYIAALLIFVLAQAWLKLPALYNVIDDAG